MLDNVKLFVNNLICVAEDEDYRPPYLIWLHDFIIKARTHGALIGEFRDKTYEARISELEQEVEKWKQAHERIKQDSIILTNELVDRQNIIYAYEKVFYKKGDTGNE